MDVKTWTTISRLLDDALDLPPAERDAWLASLGPEYDACRPRLRDLLHQAASTDSASFLATLPKFAAASDDGDADADFSRANTTIGPYRLVRVLASGGQGSVWLAERVDGLVNRPVALKLPHGLASRSGLADRLARERNILAALNHPHIARLYDAGITAAGEPYLALEYVEGTPIDRHCSDRGLSTHDRVRLFLQVARAVAYAHGQLVIHRDLKPSNILVTPEGYVRLLDFGIAKLLASDVPVDSTLTADSGRALTLPYASPEQVLQQPLGVATDVYSLGVVLYELVTGTRPHRPERDTPAALEEAILHDEVKRPSEVATEPAARKALRGDLDTIVLKALKTSTAERYGSVEAFGDDLERALDGRPVLAQPDSRMYRARKFVARNRFGVASAAAVLLAIVGGAGLAVWQARVAIAEKARAEEVKGVIASIFKDANIDTGDGTPLPASGLLKQANDRLIAATLDPAIRVELLQIIGEGLVSLRDGSASVDVLSRAITDAAALYGPEHITTLRARLTRGWGYVLSGRMKELEQELPVLLPLLERHSATTPADLAQRFRLEAHGAFQRGAFDEAAADAEKALVHAERAQADADRVQILTQAAEAYSFAGKHEQARGSAERARSLGMKTFAGNEKHPHMMFLREIYAVVLGRSGDPDAALDELAQTLAGSVALYGPESVTVGNIHNNMVTLQLQAGRVEDALRSSGQALAILSKHNAPDSYPVAAANNARARSLVRARRGAEALPVLDDVAAFATKTFGPTHPNTLTGRSSRALALSYVGQTSDALREIQAVVTSLRAANAPLAGSLHVEGIVRQQAGDRVGARQVLEEALSHTRDTPAGWLDRANVSVALGVLQLDAGESEAAAASIEPALSKFESARKTLSPEHADALVAMARVRIAQQRVAEARPLLERADEFWRAFDPQSRWAQDTARWLAR